MENTTLESIYQEHMKKEPKRYSKFFKEINRGIETGDYITWKIKGKQLSEAIKVPRNKRQEVLDTLKKGLSIGETGKELKIDSEVVSTILYYNIGSVKMLRSESI